MTKTAEELAAEAAALEAAALAEAEKENGAEDKKVPGAVPYSRFKEVIAQRSALETKLAELEAKMKKADEKELEETNNFRQLAEERRIENEKVSAQFVVNESALSQYKTILSTAVNDMTSNWPEEVKVFDPGEEAEPLARFEWAKKAQALVAKMQEAQPPAPGAPGTVPKPPAKDPNKKEADFDLPISVKRSF